MTAKQYELTEAEWDIIEVVWEHEPCADSPRGVGGPREVDLPYRQNPDGPYDRQGPSHDGAHPEFTLHRSVIGPERRDMRV